VFVPLLLLTISIANLPLSMYSHHISLQYGFSIQGWGSWFIDFAKSELVSLALFTPLLRLMLGVIHRSPHRCWLYFCLIAQPILFFVVLIAPVAIDPLYYNFTPLENTQPKL